MTGPEPPIRVGVRVPGVAADAAPYRALGWRLFAVQGSPAGGDH